MTSLKQNKQESLIVILPFESELNTEAKPESLQGGVHFWVPTVPWYHMYKWKPNTLKTKYIKRSQKYVFENGTRGKLQIWHWRMVGDL